MATRGLLLVDVQKDYFPGGNMALHKVEEAGKNAQKVLEHFRAQKLPVVHVRHEFPPSSLGWLEKGTEGAEIHPLVAPLEGEPVITKNYVNSFRETALEETLKKFGIEELVVVGAMSHMCIDGAVRAAADLGYKCIVPQDACACPDVTFGDKTVAAENVHATIMGALGFAYAKVTTTAELLDQ